MLTGLFQAGAFLTACFSLTTLFNHLHPWLELFSHFRLQYFVCSLLLLLVFAVLRDRLWTGGMLVLALLNFVPLSAWYLSVDSNTDAVDQTITIMQANVLGRINTPERAIAQIAAEQPDIIFLQEINVQWVTALQQIAATFPYMITVPRDDNFGIAVYARSPLLDAKVIASSRAGLPTLLVRQELGEHEITYITTHPLPPLGKAKTASRNEQLQNIATLLASIEGPKVLVGDLNISMWAHHYQELEEKTGLRNTRLGFGIMPTWPQHLRIAAIPIDHCLVSGEFQVLGIHAGSSNGSDHLPLFIKLAL